MSYKYLLCRTEMISLKDADISKLQDIHCSPEQMRQRIDELIGAAYWSDEGEGVFFGYGPKPEHRYEIWVTKRDKDDDVLSVSVSGLSEEGLRTLSEGLDLALFDCQSGERLDNTGFTV